MKDSVLSPEVSVIIPTFNRPEFLQQAVFSVLKQSYTDFEVIIVNDGGKDVGDMLESIKDNRISYIIHTRNQGLSRARNTGIEHANGRYIAFLDDDDIYYPNHLKIMVESLKNSPYAFAYSDSIKNYEWYDKNYNKRIYKEIYFSPDYHPIRIMLDNVAPVNAFVLKKEIINDSFLFDTELKSHEDWDQWIRLSIKYKGIHIPKVTCEVRFRFDGSTMTNSLFLDYERDRTKIKKKYENILKIRLKEYAVKKKKNYFDYLYLGQGYKYLENKKAAKYYLKKVMQYEIPARIEAEVLLELNDLNLRKKYIKRAIKCLESIKPKTNGQFNTIGIKYYDIGDYINAEKVFKFVLRRRIPQGLKIKAYYYLGNIYFKKKRTAWKVYLKKWLYFMENRKQKRDIDLYRIASVREQIGDLQKSIILFKDLVDNTSDKQLQYGSFFHLGEIFFKIDKVEQAKYYYEKCIDLNPNHKLAKKNISFIKKKQKNVKDSLKQ